LNSSKDGGRRAQAWFSRALTKSLGTRSSILDRVRFLFLLFFVLNATISAFFVLRGPRQDLTQLIASYSLTYLVLYAAVAYWRGKSPLWMDLVAAAALFGAGLEVSNPVRLYLLFYGVLLFRSLFGSAWGVAAITTLFLAPLIAAVAWVTITTHGDPQTVAQVLVNVPGFAAGGWLMHQVKVTLAAYMEALRRERVLTESADVLVAVENPPAVYEAAIAGAMGLVESVRGARTSISVGNGRMQRQVAVGPPTRLVEVPEVRVAELPEQLRSALREQKAVSLTRWPSSRGPRCRPRVAPKRQASAAG